MAPRILPLTLIAALLVTLLPLTGAAADPTPTPTPDPRVVVAVIDEPINPYHDWFHQGGPLYGDTAPSSVTPDLLAELGITEDRIIRLTRTGDWAADFAADKATFDAAKDGQLYWYEGTNVIAASFDTGDTTQLLPDTNAESHGTGTSGAVLLANPDAVIIHVDAFTDAAAELFVARLPQVDILSSSYGYVGGAPVPLSVEGSYEGVVRNGKLHFGAAGNQPTPDQQSLAGGAWWLIGVGGYHEGSTEGQEPLAALTPDFAGDFTQDLPRCGRCEAQVAPYSGTSFSSPRAAGTASLALLRAREAAGHVGGIVTEGVDRPAMIHTDEVTVTNWDLRRALEEAAWVPGVGDYNPGLAIPVVAAAPQVGWGVLTPEREVIEQTVAHLGLGGEITRTKPAETCAFMTVNQEFRHLYWDSLVTSDSFGESDYPYQAC